MKSERSKNSKLQWLKSEIVGKVSKKDHLQYFLAVVLVYAIGIAIGAAFYPGGFSMVGIYISYLGGNENNPEGFVYYNISVFITGILLTPHFLYLYRRLKWTPKWLKGIMSFFGMVGTLGFAFIGIFYQGSSAIGHRWTTILAFGGLGGAAFLHFLIWFILVLKNKPWPKWKYFIITYIQLFGILGLTLVFHGNEELVVRIGLDPKYAGDRFWEWFYMFAVMGWLIDTALFSKPDEVN